MFFEDFFSLGGAVLADIAIEAGKEHARLRGGTAAERAVFFVRCFLGHYLGSLNAGIITVGFSRRLGG